MVFHAHTERGYVKNVVVVILVVVEIVIPVLFIAFDTRFSQIPTTWVLLAKI